MFCEERFAELHSWEYLSLRDCTARDVLIGCAFSGALRRTFVDLDGDVTASKPGEQTVVREVLSRSEDDALVNWRRIPVQARSHSICTRAWTVS